MLIDVAHIRKIGRVGVRKKHLPGIAALLLLAGCSGSAVVESSATAVTVRYSAVDGIDEATQTAQRACAAHHKSARLRNTANFGLDERYAHFDCI
jgi:outer membrane murein-binding lipoprotein Lpp